MLNRPLTFGPSSGQDDGSRQSRPLAVWDDRLLRWLAPQGLWSLRPVWRYAVAVVIVAAATVLRCALVPWMGTAAPYNVALAAVIVTTALLGLGPGLLSVLLGDIAVEVFVLGSFAGGGDGTTGPRLGVSIALGAIVCWILHAVRAVESKSRQTAAEWEQTFDSVPDLIAILDRQHRVLRANRAMAERLGVTAEQWCGAACYRAVHGLEAPPDACPHARALAEGRECVTEIHEDRLGGDFTISCTPLFDASGRIVSTVHVARNISERKRAEAELDEHRHHLEQLVEDRTAELRKAHEAVEAERQRFKDVLDQLPAYLVLLSPDYRVPFANRYFEERFGKSQRRRCYEYLFGRSEPCENCETYKVLKTGAPHRWEWTGPDGRDYDIYDFPFTDTDGSTLIMEVGLDITERKRAETNLLAASGYARSLIEASVDPLVTISPSGKITDVNEATVLATGVPRERLVGSDFSDYFTEPEKARAGYERVLAQGEVRDYPLTIRHVSGRATDVLYNATLYRNGTGEVQGVFAAARDVTERKRVEAELARHREHLEELVQERTGQLEAANAQLQAEIAERARAEQALRESERRIRASLAEKEVLLKEIHHRVKNNMQVISSLVDLQAERLHDAAMRSVLRDVTHRVRSMALVHEKLYQSDDLARVEFAEYAQSLLHYLWRAHGSAASGVRLTLDLEPVPLSVNAAVPCGLVLNELASNALKHAFRGCDGGKGDRSNVPERPERSFAHIGPVPFSPEVAVSLRGGPEGRVCLRVRDNGAGLPAGFDWRRADSLGLRLVEMLARQLHAAVEVSSGEGTEFTVTFPGR